MYGTHKKISFTPISLFCFLSVSLSVLFPLLLVPSFDFLFLFFYFSRSLIVKYTHTHTYTIQFFLFLPSSPLLLFVVVVGGGGGGVFFLLLLLLLRCRFEQYTPLAFSLVFVPIKGLASLENKNPFPAHIMYTSTTIKLLYRTTYIIRYTYIPHTVCMYMYSRHTHSHAHSHSHSHSYNVRTVPYTIQYKI